MLKYAAGIRYCEQHPVHFDLVNILSGYIQGRNELYNHVEDMEEIATLGSNEGVMYTALGKSLGFPRLTHQVFLDDVATAHVVALQRSKHLNNFIVAGNEGRGTPWADIIPIIQRLYPKEVANGLLRPGVSDPDRIVHYDVSSSEEALGMKFSGMETMVKSVIDQYLEFQIRARK